MDKTLRPLIVEDCEDDALLVVRALERGGFRLQWQRVETAEAMYQALRLGETDVIIADYRLPAFSAPEAIKMRDRLAPETPLIVVSGTIGEETAADAMRAGAQDYVMKGNLTRLVAAVERELREASIRRQSRAAESALERVRAQFATLFENTHDLVQSVDDSGRFLFVNRAWFETLGYTIKDFPTLKLDDVVHPESTAEFHAVLAMVKTGLNPKDFQLTLRTKNGSDVFTVGHAVSYSADGKFISTLSILHDITTQKKNEERIVHLNRVLGVIRDINQLIVFENEEKQLLQKACDRMVRGSDYGAAWISLRQADGTMLLAANAGETVDGCGCVERVVDQAVFDREPLVRHECRLGRFAAAISLPLVIEGKVVGIFNACSVAPPSLTREEQGLMLELAKDLALGMEKIRKREELRQRNEFIETIMDNLPIGLSVNAPGQRFQYMNRQFQETYGWSVDIINDVDQFFDHVYPDPEFRRQIKARIMGDIESGDARRMVWEDVPITTQKGEQRVISARNIPLPEQDLMISTVWDVTARHKAEEEAALKARLLDSATDSIFLAEIDGGIVYANEFAYTSRGYTQGELLGMNIRDLRTPDQSIAFTDRVNKTLADGEAFFESAHRRKDGAVMQVEVRSKVIESGGRRLILSVVRDITERRKMENQMVVTDRLASVGELASGIAHEINNPLTGVIGFAELLMEKQIPPDIRDDVEVIYREAMRCAEIIRNLLTFARQHPPQREMLDINTVIEKVLQLRAYEEKANNIGIIKRLAENLPQIPGDFFRLQQCFLNIIINAEYFMHQSHGGGNLTVSTELVDSYVRVTLTDDGPGIPPEVLDRIFDPFFTTKEVGKGTGLGLSICYGLITDHGGKIKAENAPGGGASFIIELPLEAPADLPAPTFIE